MMMMMMMTKFYRETGTDCTETPKLAQNDVPMTAMAKRWPRRWLQQEPHPARITTSTLPTARTPDEEQPMEGMDAVADNFDNGCRQH
jgi:hypothetical protein